MKNKYTLVTECLKACQIHEANLQGFKNILDGAVLGKMDADELRNIGGDNTVHNTIEGLRITQSKLRDVLMQRVVKAAAYSPSGRFLGYRPIPLGKFMELPIATADSEKIETMMKQVKPEHQDWEFRQINPKVVLGYPVTD